MSNKSPKSSPLFNHINDVKLQTWNRCAIVFNLLSAKGEAAAKEYLECFSDADKARINGMFGCIKKFGYDAVRKQIKVEGQQ